MTDPAPGIQRLAAQVVVPVLDLRNPEAFAAHWAEAERLRDLGVGGFILFGGEHQSLPARLHAFKRAAPGAPPLIASDLERGVGQQVRGCAELPPLMVLGATDDEALAAAAGQALAAEARAVGIDWIFAPVLDLADEPRNPIVGTRALGADPERVAALGSAYLRGIAAGGALACAKHFPGHGATTADSHADLPRVERGDSELRARDLLPFRRAIAAKVGSVMTAHVSYPTLTPEAPATPCTLNLALAKGLLRDELGFDGLCVTDALIMDGVRPAGLSEAEAATRALAAGCDVLLYPRDPDAVIRQVARWAAERPRHAARLREAVSRLEAARARLGEPIQLEPATRASHALAGRVAAAAVTRRGPARDPLRAGDAVGLLVVDDDGLSGLGHELVAALDAAGVQLNPAIAQPDSEPEALARWMAVAEGAARLVVVVGCRIRAWKERAGLVPGLRALVAGLPGERTTVVGLCGPYALAGAVPPSAELLLAYGDEPCAQRAAAAVLLGAAAPGRLPVSETLWAELLGGA